jgi:hypothetical protein
MKREVRVKFLFRRHDQKKWYSDFFLAILDKRYQVVIDEESPDFIFHEAHLVDVIKYAGVRIALSGENVRTDFNISDYGIGFDHLTFQDRYLRFPLYLFYSGSLKLAEERSDSIRTHPAEQLINRKFCNFLVSNGDASQFRTQFFKELSRYRQVDSGGRFLNTIGQVIENKLEWQKGYKFSMCFENSSTSGYLTEKLIQAYSATTLPIYWGDPDAAGELSLGKGGINPKAVIWVTPRSPFDAIQRILELDSHPEQYLAALCEPLFLDNDHSNRFKLELEKFLFSIFDQDKEEAFRRGFGQMRMRVENRNIARSNILNSMLSFIKKRTGN